MLLINQVEISLGELIFQFSMLAFASFILLLLFGTAWVCAGAGAGAGDSWVVFLYVQKNIGKHISNSLLVHNSPLYKVVTIVT